MPVSLTNMKPMERHRYITTNKQVCNQCKKEKRLNAFVNKERNELNDTCNVCSKKICEHDILKIVLGVLNKKGIE